MHEPAASAGRHAITRPAPPAAGAAAQLARRRAFVRRVALVCAVLVLVITSLSAFIRLSRAGLSCVPQPQCYGQALRELQQGLPATLADSPAITAARMAHRVTATAALLLVVLMVITCLSERPVLWREGRVALLLLALALLLALLGRWSGNARVPAVAIGNLLGGFAMFALCCGLARGRAAAVAPWLRVWAGLGVAVLLAQVALGGLVSASHAATSCSGLADCIAASGAVPWNALDPWREPVLSATPPHNAWGALAQAAHRVSALLVLLVLLPLGLAALRGGRRAAGALLLALLVAEVAVGWLMGPPGLPAALAHNLLGALLLATTFALARGADELTPA